MRKLVGVIFLMSLVYGGMIAINVVSTLANIRYEAQVYANVVQPRRQRNPGAEQEMIDMIRQKTGVVVRSQDVEVAQSGATALVRVRVQLPIRLPLINRTLLRPMVVERRGQVGRGF